MRRLGAPNREDVTVLCGVPRPSRTALGYSGPPWYGILKALKLLHEDND